MVRKGERDLERKGIKVDATTELLRTMVEVVDVPAKDELTNKR